MQTESQGQLIQIQPNFKGDLIDKVQVFIVDVSSFSSDYHSVRGRLHSPCHLHVHVFALSFACAFASHMTCYYYSFARVGVDDYLKALVIKFEMPGSKSYTLPYNYNFFLVFLSSFPLLRFLTLIAKWLPFTVLTNNIDSIC